MVGVTLALPTHKNPTISCSSESRPATSYVQGSRVIPPVLHFVPTLRRAQVEKYLIVHETA